MIRSLHRNLLYLQSLLTFLTAETNMSNFSDRHKRLTFHEKVSDIKTLAYNVFLKISFSTELYSLQRIHAQVSYKIFSHIQ